MMSNCAKCAGCAMHSYRTVSPLEGAGNCAGVLPLKRGTAHPHTLPARTARLFDVLWAYGPPHIAARSAAPR